MNAQIKKLAEQAEQYASEKDRKYDGAGNLNWQWQDIKMEKFAELIVQECISINRQRMFSEWEGDSHRVAHNNALLCANSDMFEHFGVGE